MEDCIFCRIARKEIPAEIEVETENLIAFKDNNPKAPIHLLIVPKKHISNIKDDNGVVWAATGKLAIKIANKKGINGFRLVHNVGKAAVVPHMHVHFLGNVTADREV